MTETDDGGEKAECSDGACKQEDKAVCVLQHGLFENHQLLKTLISIITAAFYMLSMKPSI
jgi:hypothetical protein